MFQIYFGNKKCDRQTDGWMHGQIDRWMDDQTMDRQTAHLYMPQFG